MNANAVVSGEVYACTNYISRNTSYYSDAYPVKAVYVFPERLYGRTRDTWMVEVILLNDDEDLTHKIDFNGADKTKKVRARDIYALWEDHAGERELRRQRRLADEKQYEEQRKIRERERAERFRKEEEARLERVRLAELQRQREEAEKDRLIKYMAMRGIPTDAILTVNGATVTIDRMKLQKALGMKELVQ